MPRYSVETVNLASPVTPVSFIVYILSFLLLLLIKAFLI